MQTYRFGRETFDLVICYNVIEHLPHVDAALLNFRDALKRGGMILIGAPNPRSLSGVVTKYSPHWFHVWFYRHIRGIKDAGLPGEPPFPTFFHPLVTLPRLEAFAHANGLEMIYRREVESPRYPEMRRRKPLFAALVDAGAAVLNAVLPRGTDVDVDGASRLYLSSWANGGFNYTDANVGYVLRLLAVAFEGCSAAALR